MTKIVPIAISVLRYKGRFLFLKRNRPPYENLWSMVGGKLEPGEHILEAARREIIEETSTSSVENYAFKGLVSERLVDENGSLLAHFLIHLGMAEIGAFSKNHREGELALFKAQEVHKKQESFLPSDWYMFNSCLQMDDDFAMFEAELLRTSTGYHLVYYREAKP
ncbi:MAG: NUDIX domain-containing protein [Candidatus Thorarchaeota archaeon]|nr:MAG: NUDIX domain-containing protein [Candidatus Thorarchaeota archaeon]